jgi:peptide/nickel transport system ATP-binding protein
MNEEKNIYLSVKDLVVEYTSGDDIVQAVNGVSFELERGKSIGLVGETGAGKTTIAKSIMQILPVPPAVFKSGEIIVDGQNVAAMKEEEKRRYRGSKMAMIFQDPMTALNPLQTIGDQICEVLMVHDHKMSRKDAMKRATEMLEFVGIAGDRITEYPHQFSGGMKQRVVIAIALACNPELLIADEPTTALDVTIQAQILELIRKLQKKNNTSLLLITHDLGIVAEYCDTVAVVYAGEIVEYAPKRELFKNRKHPYTNGLFDSVPSITGDETRLKPIPGMLPDPTHLGKGCKFADRCQFADEQCRCQEIALTKIADDHYCRCIRIS